MQFKEIVGHKTEKTELCGLVRGNRLSHSLLFLGREGSGALPMALAFAQYILCERAHPSPDSRQAASLFGEVPDKDMTTLDEDSCGVCTACVKAEKNIHPDLHFSYPALKRNANHSQVLSTDYITEWREFLKENPYGNIDDWLDFLRASPTAKIEDATNKQANISVFECDDILRKLSLKPFESDYKILVMWMPEFLGKEGNRLLKLIEEPPAGTIFIFVAEDESKILPTILSRTQLVKIPLPEDSEVKDFLTSKGCDSQTAHQIAAASYGNLREALRLMNAGDTDWLQMLRKWMNVIYANKVAGQISWIDEINQIGKEGQKQLLQHLLRLIEMGLRSTVAAAGNDEPETGEAEFAATLGKMCSIEMLDEMSKELDNAIYYLERNANSKLLFHALTIRFYHLIREKKLILVH